MKNDFLKIATLALALIAGASACRAADLQAKTTDGQLVQGEYLGTENNVVKIKTAYGIVSIPSKDIVSLTAVESAPQPATPAPALTAVIGNNSKDGETIDAPSFKEPKGVNMSALLASRMPFIPEAIKQNRIELVRLIRNFSDSSDASRLKIIRTLQNYGLMAYPFVDASYTGPGDLRDKIELLQAVSVPHKPFSAGMLATTHAEALAECNRTASLPPALPPEVRTIHNRTPNRQQLLRSAARDVRTIEGYASVSGGPFNAMFLLNVYKERYAGESDPLLKDLLTDRARLSAATRDHKNKADAWLPADRVLLIEMALPLYFGKNDDLKSLVEDALKNLLPEKHPKLDAPEADWVEWWKTAKSELLK